MTKKVRTLEEDVSKCPECSGQVVANPAKGERHCELCGLVVDYDMVSHNADYRVYSSNDYKGEERIGPPTTETLHDRGMATTIDYSMKDAYGSALSSDTKRDVHKFRKLQHKANISNSQERNLIFALTEITRMSSHLQLTDDVKRETAHLYRRAVSENIIRGRSIQAVIASSFYLAGRICGHPRTLDEIAQAVGVSRKECGRIARFIKKKFEIRLDPPTGDDFLERFCQILKMSCKECDGLGVKGPKCSICKGTGNIVIIANDLKEVLTPCKDCLGRGGTGPDCSMCDGLGMVDLPVGTINQGRELMTLCEEHGLYSGKAPMGLVAAVLYTAVDDDVKGQITQKEVAVKCSVTEVTLRNRCKDISDLRAGKDDISG